jgi:hypothetical protein
MPTWFLFPVTLEPQQGADQTPDQDTGQQHHLGLKYIKRDEITRNLLMYGMSSHSIFSSLAGVANRPSGKVLIWRGGASRRDRSPTTRPVTTAGGTRSDA